jgi:hypothetical protein
MHIANFRLLKLRNKVRIENQINMLKNDNDFIYFIMIVLFRCLLVRLNIVWFILQMWALSTSWVFCLCFDCLCVWVLLMCCMSIVAVTLLLMCCMSIVAVTLLLMSIVAVTLLLMCCMSIVAVTLLLMSMSIVAVTLLLMQTQKIVYLMQNQLL